jgi:preprotein translocase subunit SecE
MLEKIKNYLSETRIEIKKVTWPTIAELKESTRVVIVATLVLTVFIGIVDQILSRVIRFVLH